MTIKYKVSEVAKDLNKPAKQIIDLLAARGGEPKKAVSYTHLTLPTILLV